MTTLSLNNDRHDATGRAAQCVRDGKPFRNHSGSLSGEPVAPGERVHPGEMPRESYWLEQLEDADYVIRSYSTPIAWRVRGRWVQPEVRYSVTTSKHQGRAYMIVHLATQ